MSEPTQATCYACYSVKLPAQVDGQFVKLCKRLVLQFVIVKPIIVVLTIVLYSQGLYTEGDWSIDSSCAANTAARDSLSFQALVQCACASSRQVVIQPELNP